MSLIPEHTKYSLDEYINHGRRGGHFLDAVLSNDLSGAVARADEENAAALANIVRYIYNNAPADSWGSKDKVEAWKGRAHG